jgi:hypothetical protein
MNIDISKKTYKRFKELEECQELSEIEIEDFLKEIVEDLLEDFILDKLNKQEDFYGTGNEEDEEI